VSGQHRNAQARRVVSGLDSAGRSTIVLDEYTEARVVREASTICDVWRVDSLPPHMADDNAITERREPGLPSSGFVVRVATFPPAPEIDWAIARLEPPYSSIPDGDSDIPGLHVTETVDVVTVVSGELYAVLETTETLLRPGDTFIQRGTKHAWSNRGTEPVTVVAVMMAARRS
jgi:mannose-6-phosphate isomerase-like protein (cupin superfamily)